MVSQEVSRVKRAADKAASSRQALEQAIREARAAGVPLRTIAEAANLSPEWVRRIASRSDLDKP